MRTFGFCIILTMMMILGSSCSPCKKLWRKCPPAIHDSVSYYERTVFDTMWVPVPGDTTYIDIPVEVPLTDLNILAENSDQSVNIRVSGGRLTAKTICKEDSLRLVIKELEKRSSEIKTIIKEVEKPVPVKYIPKIVRFAAWGFLCCVIVLAFVVYSKIRSGMLKSLLSKLKN